MKTLDIFNLRNMTLNTCPFIFSGSVIMWRVNGGTIYGFKKGWLVTWRTTHWIMHTLNGTWYEQNIFRFRIIYLFVFQFIPQAKVCLITVLLFTCPVSTRRRFNVDTKLLGRQQCRYDVDTTPCVYWVGLHLKMFPCQPSLWSDLIISKWSPFLLYSPHNSCVIWDNFSFKRWCQSGMIRLKESFNTYIQYVRNKTGPFEKAIWVDHLL